MKKSILLILVLMLALNNILFAQHNDTKEKDKSNVNLDENTNKELALRYFNKGSKKFKKMKFELADSLYSISVKIYPLAETYYNLAITKYHLRDKCGYCNNMNNAAKFGHTEARKLFLSNCIKRDSINYDNNFHKDTIFYSIIETEICSNKKDQIFYIKNLNNGNLRSFNGINNYNLTNEEEDFITKFPGLKKYIKILKFTFWLMKCQNFQVDMKN